MSHQVEVRRPSPPVDLAQQNLFPCQTLLRAVPSYAKLWHMTNTTTPPTVAVNGFAFREIRIRSGIDALPCAEAVGIDRSYLNRIENGARVRVRPAVFAGMVRALGLADRRAILADPHGNPIDLSAMEAQVPT